MGRRRAVAALATAIALAAGGCSSGEVEGAGADLSKVGPPPTTAVPIPEAEPAPADGTPGAPTGRATDRVADLADALRAALADADPDAPAGSLRVEQRPAAEDQLVVTFTVSTNAQDASAPRRVRRDLAALLDVVKDADLDYGSVLLIAHGRVPNGTSRETDAQVVRAKYSRALVRRTNWAAVPVDRILTMPDDKPAEIHPAYRSAAYLSRNSASASAMPAISRGSTLSFGACISVSGSSTPIRMISASG
jgi:hypothetical protein